MTRFLTYCFGGFFWDLSKSVKNLLRFLSIVLLVSFGNNGWGQISMTTTGSHTQNFNSLATSGAGNTWTDNSTITNWYSQRTGTGTTYDADAGSSTAGNLYSYGTGTNADRAIGTIGSGGAAAGSFAHGVLLRNTSSSTITDIKVTYTLEQWRKSGVTVAQDITFYYKISSSTISSLNPNNNTGWTQVAGLTLSSPINTSTGAALDGNASANKVTATNVSISSLTLADNDYIMLKWEDPDHTGTDHGLSIDDVTISWTVTAGCTAPTTQASSITFSSVTSNSMTVNWTRGGTPGDGVIVLAKSGSSVDSDPVNNTSYTASATFGSGAQIGSGNYVVFLASGTNVNVTGLSPSTTYYFKVYEKNCSGTSIVINTTAPPSNNQATSAPGTSSASVILAVASSEPATISSLENTPSITSNLLGTQVWQFDIYDGDGTANDGDALPTNYTSFTFNKGASNTVASWTNNILDVQFFEGANVTPTAGSVSVTASTIVFTPSASISVSDGAASKITITMRMSLKNPMASGADGKIFQFKLMNTIVTTEGSGTSSQLAAFTINSDGTKNVIAVIATEFRFSNCPGAVAPASNFSSTVNATDANGNIDANSTASVTLSRFGGTGTLSSAGGLTKSLVAGIYTWTDLQFNTEETFTIKATNGVLVDGESPSIICTSTMGTVIVEWNFPNSSNDQYADAGIALNYDAGTPTNSKQISVSGASGVVYTGVGYTTKSVTASGWDAGSDTKFWQVECNATGYSYLKLSSKQRSSNSGPRDWKIQYKVGAGSWTDVTGGSVTVGDNWTTGVKTDLAIPSACDGQATLYFRWIMTSNTSVGGAAVASAGTSRMDDIIITGVSSNTITTGTIAGSPFCITSSTGISVTVPFTSTGTYNSANIYTAELSDANGSFSVATAIGTIASTANSGNISATIPAGTATGTLYRIRVKSDDPYLIGSEYSIDLTIVLNIPDASGFNATTASGQVTLGWTNPVGCFDDVLIVAKASSNVNAGTPSGDGSAYTASLVYASGSALLGGYVVYKAGTVSGQTVTNLTDGTTYYFKIFVRKGTTWSDGIEITVVSSATQTGDYKSTGTGGSWGTIATWLKYNGATWVAATEYPNDATKNVTISSGTIVDLNDGPRAVYNFTVENGAKVFTGDDPAVSTNKYVNVYGNNLICNGIIGNGSTIDAIGFRFEGINATISGTGIFDAIRIKKEYNTNLTTNLIIAMDINLRWNAVSGTQIYNNAPATTTFNVTLNAGSTLNLIVSGTGNSGNACINDVSGSGAGGGTFTINGVMNIPGIFYATSSNSSIPTTWIIGTGAVINCNQINCNASGTAGHTLRIMDGGKLNINTNVGFANFSLTNNTYDFQPGSIVEYSAPSGTTPVQFNQAGFIYANLLISGNGGLKQISGGNVTCTENLTITGGVFDANSRNITVGGNWSNYGTNGFTEGAVGTVFFNGTSAQTIACIDGEDFYNLDFTLAGTKTLLDKITAHNVTINTGSGAFIANDKDISVSGNWSNYGTTGFTEGTVATVTFNGSAAQSITCPGNENFYNLTLNNSSTGVTLNNTVIVHSSGILTLTLGIFTTGANEMRVTNTSVTSITGHQTDISLGAYTTSSRINGYLRRTVAATGSYDFPVGTSTNYEYSNINLTASSGISTIVSSFKTPNFGTTPSAIFINSTEINTLLNYGYWTISPNAVTSVTYNVTLISHGHSNGGADPTYHTVIKRDDNDAPWATYQSNHNNSTQVGSGSNPISATLTGMTGFSDMGIGLGAAPLPITLISFSGKYDDNDNAVILNWTTTQEKNFMGYMVQRSYNGSEFENIGFVESLTLNSPTKNYNYPDQNPDGNIIYYRLKMIDNDGKYSLSKKISVRINDRGFVVYDVSPNPFQNELICDFYLINAGDVNFEIYDLKGTKHNEINEFFNAGKNKFIYSNPDLTNGVYILKIKNDGKSVVKKVINNKF